MNKIIISTARRQKEINSSQEGGCYHPLSHSLSLPLSSLSPSITLPIYLSVTLYLSSLTHSLSPFLSSLSLLSLLSLFLSSPSPCRTLSGLIKFTNLTNFVRFFFARCDVLDMCPRPSEECSPSGIYMGYGLHDRIACVQVRQWGNKKICGEEVVSV